MIISPMAPANSYLTGILIGGHYQGQNRQNVKQKITVNITSYFLCLLANC